MGVPVALAIVVGLLSSFVQSLGECEAALGTWFMQLYPSRALPVRDHLLARYLVDNIATTLR
jgi:hypothetical protein